MSKIIGRFGFITYFVDRQAQRLPVEFYSTQHSLMAWLDSGEPHLRLFTPVLDPMDHKEIGGFPQIVLSYEEEVKSLFVRPEFWKECVETNSGLLLVFQVLHYMRMHGLTASAAINYANHQIDVLRASERQALADITEIYQSADGTMTVSNRPSNIFDSSR
jgi:hypothetical protein